MSLIRRPRTIWTVTVLAVALWLIRPLLAQPNDPGFDTFVEQTRQAYGVPGAVVVIVRPDRAVMAKGFGVRRAGEPAPVDENTRFQIASLSKFLTATALARLVDRGVVAWDVPVQRFSPDTVLSVPYATENATLRDYFAHRTGLPAYGGDLLHQLGYTEGEIVQRARHLPFSHTFREQWAYSNYGIFLGQAAAARAAGTSPAALVSDGLFRPLGMARSGPTLETLFSDENRAAAHGIDGAVIPYENVDGFSGAGALVSSGADVAQWMRMLLGAGMLDGKRVLTGAAVRTLLAASMVQGPGGPLHDDNDAAGLGCESYNFLGTRVIEKNGALNGVRTIVSLIPERGIGIAVFANQQLTVFPEAVRAEFLERELGPSGRNLQAETRAQQPAWHALLGLPARLPAAAPPTHPLESFAGNYNSLLYGAVSIERRGDGLEATLGPARYPGHLSHWAADTFLLSFDNPDTAPGLLEFVFAAGPSAIGIGGSSVPGSLMADYGRFDRLDAPSSARPAP